MAFGISFGGSKGRATTNTARTGIATTEELETQRQNQRQTGTTAKRTSQRTKGQQTGESLSSVSQLDQETLDQLLAVVESSGANLADLGNLLTARASNADADIAGFIDPVVGRARVVGERKIGQEAQRIAQAAGSSQNTLVAGLNIEGQAELETQLASLAATLGLQVRQVGTQELKTAADVAASGAVGVGGIAKGASQETTASQLTTALTDILGSENATTIQDLVSSLTGIKSGVRTVDEESSGKTKTRGKAFGFSGAF